MAKFDARVLHLSGVRSSAAAFQAALAPFLAGSGVVVIFPSRTKSMPLAVSVTLTSFSSICASPHFGEPSLTENNVLVHVSCRAAASFMSEQKP